MLLIALDGNQLFNIFADQKPSLQTLATVILSMDDLMQILEMLKGNSLTFFLESK